MRMMRHVLMALLVCGCVAACAHHEKPTEAEIAKTTQTATQIISDPFAVEPVWFRNWRTASYSVTESIDPARSSWLRKTYIPMLTPEYKLVTPAVLAEMLLVLCIYAVVTLYGLAGPGRWLAIVLPHASLVAVLALAYYCIRVFGGGQYYVRWDFALFLSYVVWFLLVAVAVVAWHVHQARHRHAVTVLVCGATGVGKSTLINALARRPAAATGIGAPVTQNTTYIKVPERALGFYDSRGLEVAEASETYFLLLADLLYVRYQRSIHRQIDAVLMCIQEPQGRIDDAHVEIAALCDDLHIPYGIAMTKTEGDPTLADMARATFPSARFVMPVRALELRLRHVTLPQENLDVLEQRLREVSAWTRRAARQRAQSASKTQQLAAVARDVATQAGSGRTAWVSFSAAAFTLLGNASAEEKHATWESILKEMRNMTRRIYVPNPVVRTILTKFDHVAIDEANAMRVLPRIIRRFGDGSQTLTPADLADTCSEALHDLDSKRPYRSRV